MKSKNWTWRLCALTGWMAASAAAQALPTYVDLSANQSPVKDQAGRDTCGTFASIAALEAAYRREYGLTVDLSEQYLNHWAQQFVSAGSGRALPLNETNVGSIGGGGLSRPLAAFTRGLAVPPESALTYIGDTGYQNVDPGDSPSLNDWSTTYPQRAIDDFNLADTAALYVYSPPTWNWTTVMPQAAIDAARYRPTDVIFLDASQVNQVDAYRTILAGGREVILEFRCCDGDPGFGNTQPWVLPAGSNGGGYGHVLIIVGYDDGRQMFRVKNSWGTAWADNGYAWVSYDIVRRAAQGAAYLQGAMSPTTVSDPFNFRHFYLGRWQLNVDGRNGVLDVYNLPETYTPNVVKNYRVGTLFMADGRVHRVNGQINGNALTFYVDWAQPNLPAPQLSGAAFTMWMFSWNHRAMAGTMRDGSGGTFAVQAVKGTTAVSGTAAPGGLAVASYLGSWVFEHDGWKGRLEISHANPATRQLIGKYVAANGQARALTGWIDKSDARLFGFDIAFDTPQHFDGYLNSRQLGVMAGTTVWGGMRFGFYGARR